MSEIDESALLSRAIRTLVVGSEDNAPRLISQPQEDDGGGILGFLWNAVKGVGGFIVKAIMPIFQGIAFTVGDLIRAFFVGAVRLLDFNWQITDRQLDTYLRGLEIALYGQAGETVGSALGYMVCGILPALGVAVVSEKAAIYLLKRVGEEAFEEFIENMAQLIRQSIKYAFDLATVAAFKHGRRMVKGFFRDPNSAQSTFINNIFGENASRTLATWGDEGNKPWTIRRWIEDQIEKIPDPRWEEFAEEAFDSFIDSCLDAGYILADATDDWIASQRLAADAVYGERRILEVYPNREGDERIVLAGGERQLRQTLPLMMAQYHMIEDRNVGQIIGEPVFESLSRSPSPLALKIQLSSNSRPPFTTGRRVQITIPDVNRNKIDWQRLKAALGGSNGYLWGRYLGKATLLSGYTMQVYGGTSQEASDRLKALAAFSNTEILGITVTEETKEGARQRYSSMYKEATRIYPVSFTVLNSEKVVSEASGKAQLTGVYKRRKDKFDLWVDNKPNDFQSRLSEILRSRDSN